ncbi:hypothetical protein [Pseudoclavibacter terrae]|uniref:hypothetical protein n=1 Tax=Pseudoclavibacter terrae TaxID=1530195 RepID=UPI00232AAE5A|nr:hypothetical protein [Pseudoclavibacter terrae]
MTSPEATANSAAIPREPRRQEIRLFLLGDALPCFSAFSATYCPAGYSAPRSVLFDKHPAAAVIGVDASAAQTRRQLAWTLDSTIETAIELSSRLPKLHHVVVVLDNHALPSRLVLRCADQAAHRIHEQVAREHGDYVVVTFLAVTDAVDPTMLAERLHDRIVQAPASDVATALSWDEVEHGSIAQAAINDYL